MPQTPIHSRHASITQGSPFASPTHRSSLQDPSTPSRSSFVPQDSYDISDIGGTGMGGASGLGNLADELADAFDESGDEEYYEEEEGSPQVDIEVQEGEGERNNGIDNNLNGSGSASPNGSESRSKNAMLNLPSPHRKGHRRVGSEYDGSEYGSDSDLETPATMPISLISQIDAVESLARRGTENTGTTADGVFTRVTESLKDLGSQAGVEGGATRLITAHSALTTHLSHQTRQLHNLTFPLLSPLAPPPDPETVEAMVPLLVSLSDAMPRPSTQALNAITSLHTMSSDLVQTLNYLTDTLHMSRQTTTTATRRLKSTKELVAEMKHEDELREEGERWLVRGNWSERLQKRECASVCSEVVGGFEQVCNDWRARLLAQAESGQA
ncbi:hypothetical protein TD95_004140 [Thielaviopsis punctulata]|uniref:Uncharacterized protein n=1 Tax=Thielaviopsis punctulata TaxID=72032 RepID=A0A0F4ZCK4_9PEZI|nr:hypothetical protein TD95_004140 [Thielaviopsis punctulata]